MYWLINSWWKRLGWGEFAANSPTLVPLNTETDLALLTETGEILYA